MEYEIERPTRHCATTGREFAEGEDFYSVVVSESGSLRRRDYGADAWSGPPSEAIAWWKSRMPRRDDKKNRATPSQLLLDLFHRLGPEAGQPQLRYVLALLMIRRRIFRLEETAHNASGGEVLVLYCPRDEASYQIEAVDVDAVQVQAIQDELSRLVAVDQP